MTTEHGSSLAYSSEFRMKGGNLYLLHSKVHECHSNRDCHPYSEMATGLRPIFQQRNLKKKNPGSGLITIFEEITIVTIVLNLKEIILLS